MTTSSFVDPAIQAEAALRRTWLAVAAAILAITDEALAERLKAYRYYRPIAYGWPLTTFHFLKHRMK